MIAAEKNEVGGSIVVLIPVNMMDVVVPSVLWRIATGMLAKPAVAFIDRLFYGCPIRRIGKHPLAVAIEGMGRAAPHLRLLFFCEMPAMAQTWCPTLAGYAQFGPRFGEHRLPDVGGAKFRFRFFATRFADMSGGNLGFCFICVVSTRIVDSLRASDTSLRPGILSRCAKEFSAVYTMRPFCQNLWPLIIGRDIGASLFCHDLHFTR